MKIPSDRWLQVWLVAFGLLVAMLAPADAQAQRNGKILFNVLSNDHASIVVANIDGTDRQALSIAGNVLDPSFSPDGRRILFSRIADDFKSSEIVEMNLSNRQERTLARVVGTALGPVWSPDGRQIAFSKLDPGQSATPLQCMVMGADGSAPHSISERTALAPRWSPDGKRLAFAWFDEKTHEAGIDVLDASFKRASAGILLSQPVLALAWSPDGRRIAFVKADAVDTAQLWTMDADGSHSQQQTDMPHQVCSGVEYTDDGNILLSSLYSSNPDKAAVWAVRGVQQLPLFRDKDGLDLMNAGFLRFLRSKVGSAPIVPVSVPPKQVPSRQ